jgi:hypothetical protein
MCALRSYNWSNHPRMPREGDHRAIVSSAIAPSSASRTWSEALAAGSSDRCHLVEQESGMGLSFPGTV